LFAAKVYLSKPVPNMGNTPPTITEHLAAFQRAWGVDVDTSMEMEEIITLTRVCGFLFDKACRCGSNHRCYLTERQVIFLLAQGFQVPDVGHGGWAGVGWAGVTDTNSAGRLWAHTLQARETRRRKWWTSVERLPDTVVKVPEWFSPDDGTELGMQRLAKDVYRVCQEGKTPSAPPNTND
jgi:hypothetical protein